MKLFVVYSVVCFVMALFTNKRKQDLGVHWLCWLLSPVWIVIYFSGFLFYKYAKKRPRSFKLYWLTVKILLFG